jgi:hypothetical protein
MTLNGKRFSSLTSQNVQSANSAPVVGTVLVLLGAWNVYRHRMGLATGLAICGVGLLLIWLVAPRLSRRFHQFWMAVAGALGYVNSRILLSLMFFLVITPYAVLMRLAGRDRLRRRAAGGDSYWIRRTVTRQNKPQFERLF